jgi:hypothetical protein
VVTTRKCVGVCMCPYPHTHTHTHTHTCSSIQDTHIQHVAVFNVCTRSEYCYMLCVCVCVCGVRVYVCVYEVCVGGASVHA